MTDSPTIDGHHCRTTFRALSDAADALRRLDEQWTDLEAALATRRGRRWRLRTSDERTVFVEGGRPFTTLYVTPSSAIPRSEDPPLRPALELSRFCRIWRPPVALLGPPDRHWLARQDLEGDPAPPLPARFDAEHGWRDVPPEQLSELIAIVRRTTRDCSNSGHDSDPHRGAA